MNDIKGIIITLVFGHFCNTLVDPFNKSDKSPEISCVSISRGVRLL